ncbi:hypothetical protein FEM48_Zijuj07G0050800 [Ziziphus jujuba var. spinosa]|uniref:RRM domain-containing protein n=1 Tax=Ziziphus jujuba var. spinosa TaxID=714518 RepID=A0A978V2M1_ZIZJJ|nr:hypothetical protein FEM48_Zijuj07G0050800 [Ziziphus jujuba var. spinosa]
MVPSLARVIIDRNTGRSRGFGFVNFSSDDSASSALSAMDGQDLQGRHIRGEKDVKLDIFSSWYCVKGQHYFFSALFSYGESVLHHVAEKTPSIKRKIENIYANKTIFGIEAQSHADEEAEQSLQQQRRRNVEEEDVVGFGDDTAKLVDQLLDQGRLQREFVGQVSDETNKMSDEQLKGELREKLKGKRYFVVMDDVWKPQFWDEIRACLPDDSNGSRILITSREKEVASNASSTPPYFLPFLDEEASWELLCKKVFRGEKCPSNLESLGRQLAESCKGLPLSIVVLGDFRFNHLKWASKNFRFIRLLSVVVNDLNCDLNFPKEVGQLVFLRYLKIVRWQGGYALGVWKSFPSFICKLPYLETIHVQGWTDMSIPNEIWMMKQLRHLYIPYGIELKPPSKVGHTLSNLKVLSLVHVDKKTSILFQKSLFPNLRKLHLGKLLEGVIDESMASEILASLESLRNLQTLKLRMFKFGQRLDLFSSSSSSSKLTKITFVDCKFLDSNHFMGSLGKLANLQILKINKCDMSSRQLHFMAGEFPQLEVFKMIGLRDIEAWELETHAMPNLQHLVIKRCTSLRNLPDELWSLANLRMVQVSDIETDLKEKLVIKQSEMKENGYSCKLIIN